MLSYEWRELETVCQRISDLRDRYTHARRSKNHGLIEGLKRDLALARRQREHLVYHISAHLGAATERHHPPHPAPDQAPRYVTTRAGAIPGAIPGAILDTVDDEGPVPPL